MQLKINPLFEVRLPYEPVRPSVGLSVCQLVDRYVSLLVGGLSVIIS